MGLAASAAVPFHPDDRTLNMIKALGYAAKHSFSRLKPFEFEREEPAANEVQIEVLFCGVCHSDIHQVKSDGPTPSIPACPGTRSSAG